MSGKNLSFVPHCLVPHAIGIIPHYGAFFEILGIENELDIP